MSNAPSHVAMAETTEGNTIMDFLKKLGAALGSLAVGAGALIDAVIPVAQGDRTKIAALAAVSAKVACSVVGPFAPAACPIIDSVANVAAYLVPLFAYAGVVRSK